MNIDFSTRAGFSSYVLLLIASGLVMIAVGSPAVRRQRRFQRLLNVAFGFGFLGYGIYLAFVFKGGHYVIFFQAFILPILLIARTIRSAKATPQPTPASSSFFPPPAAPLQPAPPPGYAVPVLPASTDPFPPGQS